MPLRKERKGGLNFGTAVSASIPSITACVAKVAEKFPTLDINVREDVVENLWAGLFDGSLDMAVSTIFSAKEKGLVAIPLYEVAVLAVAHASHPAAKKNNKAESLTDSRWAVIDAAGVAQNVGTYFHRAGISPPTHPVRVSTPSALITLVKTGKFLAVMPDIWVKEELKRREIIPITKPFIDLKVKVGLIYRDHLAINEVARSLIEEITALNMKKSL